MSYNSEWCEPAAQASIRLYIPINPDRFLHVSNHSDLREDIWFKTVDLVENSWSKKQIFEWTTKQIITNIKVIST